MAKTASFPEHQSSAGITIMAATAIVLEAPLIKHDGARGALQLLPERIEVLGRGGVHSCTLIIGNATPSAN
jgi:hypothetical protein